MANPIMERNQAGIGQGSFSYIEKTHWQEVTPTSWQLPTLEQCVISVSKGAFAAACVLAGGVGYSLAGGDVGFFTVLGLSSTALVMTTLYNFQCEISTRIETGRLQELSREVYEKESRAAASASYNMKPWEIGFTCSSLEVDFV